MLDDPNKIQITKKPKYVRLKIVPPKGFEAEYNNALKELKQNGIYKINCFDISDPSGAWVFLDGSYMVPYSFELFDVVN